MCEGCNIITPFHSEKSRLQYFFPTSKWPLLSRPGTGLYVQCYHTLAWLWWFPGLQYFLPTSKWPLMHLAKHPLTVISKQPQSLNTPWNSHTAQCILASSDYILHTGLYNAKWRLLTARRTMHPVRCTQSKLQNGGTSKWVYPWGCSSAAPNLGLIGQHYKPHTAHWKIHTAQ